jgi:hypothetical protein
VLREIDHIGSPECMEFRRFRTTFLLPLKRLALSGNVRRGYAVS